MRLRRLSIHHLPGIAKGFELEKLDLGVNVVVGPNAAGKSSVLRALRAVLYPEELRDAALHVEAAFDDDAGTLTVTRLGRDLTWRRRGQPAAPPPLPEHRFLPCYTLGVEDLLDADGPADREITRRLARELAGGYDLNAVRDNPPFQLKQNHGRAERQALDEARDRQRRIEAAHQALRADEDRLQRLRADRDACTDAVREAEACGKALELLEAQRRRRALEEQAARFPPAMERLRGDARLELERLHEARRALENDSQQVQRARDQALQRLAQSGLADVGVDAAAVADQLRRAHHLQRLEDQVMQHRGELERAAAERGRAIEALGGEPDRPPGLEPDSLHQVESHLAERRRLDAELRELDAALARLPAAADPDLQVEPLRRGREALLAWLTASRHSARQAVRASLMVALAAALVGVGAAAALVHWAVVAVALPLAVAVILLARSGGTAARSEARRRFADCGLAEPPSWRAADVVTRLEELDQRLQEAVAHAADLARHQETRRLRATKATEREQADTALAGLATRVGFDPRALDTSLARWLQLLGDYDRAHGACAKAREALAAREEEARGIRASLTTFLAAHGEAPAADQPDGETLAARLESLADRVRRRDEARREVAAAERELERATRALTDNDQQVNELFNRMGLESRDEAELDHRLARLDAWKALGEDLQAVRAQEQDRARSLGERPDLAARVDADDKAALQSRWEEHRDRAARRDDLVTQIAGIEARVNEARHRRDLEDARAKAQTAEDALAERLEEAQFAAAGAFLIDRVREEHEHASQPAALRRAADWFLRFTHHQYALEFATDGERHFAARETATDERRGLAELSSGTRMQLLLAVRIAFALEAERGREALPLMLDEALTTADPQRFAAAAESLSTLAREDGRQVFYMTAQPGDIAYWTAHGIGAHCIDLARVRRTGEAITDGRRITVPAPPEVPAPAGQSPEDYAVTLGVPAVDPWSPPAAVHIFHLLRDDLTLLHRLVQEGIHRMGALRTLLDSPAADVILSEEQGRRLQRRIAGIEPWLEAWRRGRGRPVDRRALEESQAVSATFLDSVAALNERLGGDARALLRALEDGKVDRFRATKREDLQDWLTAHGYLDDRAPLSEAEIRHQVLAVINPYFDRAEEALDEAQRLASSLQAGVGTRPEESDTEAPRAATPGGR